MPPLPLLPPSPPPPPPPSPPPASRHPLLLQYYPHVLTLREYALSKLPKTSRIRRRKIAVLGLDAAGKVLTDVERSLGRFLDAVLVGLDKVDADPPADNRWEQWISFSQKNDESYVTLSDGVRGALFSQTEVSIPASHALVVCSRTEPGKQVVDFVIWLLFSRDRRAGGWPSHLLCDGFRKNVNPNQKAQRGGPAPRAGVIPGLFSAHANHRVHMLKQDPWPQVLLLLGQAGERIMIDLLLDCAIFTPIDAGKGNLYQLSGAPIADRQTLAAAGTRKPEGHGLSPCEITFVKSRMLYARAALNARGLVQFGLRHIRRPQLSCPCPPVLWTSAC